MSNIAWDSNGSFARLTGYYAVRNTKTGFCILNPVFLKYDK